MAHKIASVVFQDHILVLSQMLILAYIVSYFSTLYVRKRKGILSNRKGCRLPWPARHPGREELSFHWPYPRLVPCLDDAACRAFALLEQDTCRTKTDAEMDLIRTLLVPKLGDAQNA